MVDWLKRLVAGEGNVLWDRSLTNWNTLDVASIVAAKKQERLNELQRDESTETEPEKEK